MRDHTASARRVLGTYKAQPTAIECTYHFHSFILFSFDAEEYVEGAEAVGINMCRKRLKWHV